MPRATKPASPPGWTATERSLTEFGGGPDLDRQGSTAIRLRYEAAHLVSSPGGSMDDTEITDEADGPYDDSTNSSELGEPLDYEDGDEQVDRSSDEPDVFLDVRQLRVDEITLDVEDLQARVSLQAEVLDLLKL